MTTKTTTTTATCPICGGEQLPGHPGGPLVFQHAALCPLLTRLDARVKADADALRADGWGSDFERAATAEELVLAEVAGLVPAGAQAATVTVSSVAGVAVVRREIHPIPYRQKGNAA